MMSEGRQPPRLQEASSLRPAGSRRLAGLLQHLLLKPRSSRAAASPSTKASSSSTVASKIQIEALPGLTLGATVRGLSLRTGEDDLEDPEVWELVRQAFLDYGMLVFPGQVDLTQECRDRFSRRFGPLDHRLTISNIRKDGSLIAAPPVTEGWHTDMNFAPVSLLASTLYAENVPAQGGETGFADMQAAYDALDEATKRKIEDMKSYNSIDYASLRRTGKVNPRPPMKVDYVKKTPDGVMPFIPGEAYPPAPPLRPLVKVHPETGKKALQGIGYVSFGIVGLPREESTQLLDDLCNFACQAPRVYLHAWKPGDLVIWDNRRLLHRANPWDYSGEKRLLHGTRITGDPITEACIPVSSDAESERILAEELEKLREEKAWETAGQRIR